MKKLLFTIQSYIERLLFGGSCSGCGIPGPAICRACLVKIPLSALTENQNIYGIYNYGDSIVSHAVWSLKYSHRGQTAKLLAKKAEEMLIDIISEQLQTDSPEKIIFVPIPQYKKKTETRGFNQSLLIAKWFSDGIPNSSVLEALEKFEETLPQSHISSRDTRLKNVHGVMRARTKIDPKSIYIVVDDVTTTGATFLEAIRALKEVGAKNIICIALAHGYKRK